MRENSGQEDTLSKSHAFSCISHKSEHFDFPHFFSSVSSGHDRSRLAPSSYYYTTQLVLTCMRVSGCTLHNIQDRRANLKPIKTNRIKEAVLFPGVSWGMSAVTHWPSSYGYEEVQCLSPSVTLVAQGRFLSVT